MQICVLDKSQGKLFRGLFSCKKKKSIRIAEQHGLLHVGSKSLQAMEIGLSLMLGDD